MALVDAPVGGGGFFKPENHATDLALLIDVKQFKPNQKNEYQGVISHRDEVVADISVFKTSESLKAGKPSEILKGATIAQQVLAANLADLVGSSTIVIVKKPKRAWVWDVPTFEGAKAAVADYYAKREAETAAAVADAPSFD